MTTFASTPLITYHSAQANGAANITITQVASLIEGDVLFVSVETQGGEAAPTPACSGLTFAQAGDAQTSGTGTGSARLTLFWARIPAAWTSANITIADAGDHVIARATSVKNLPLTGDPWHALAGGSESTSDTSGSAPGLTTTVDNTIILVFTARGNDSAATTHGSWANASLSYIVELYDGGSTDGSGGGIAAAAGPRATAGTVSATTYTLSGSAQKAFITLALAGRSVANVIVNPDAALPNATGSFFSWTTFSDVYGNAKGFKDCHSSGSGDICLCGRVRETYGSTGASLYLFWTAATSGSSWTPVKLIGGNSDAFWFGFFKCVTQTSDGKIHVVHDNSSTGYLVYYRLTPTYTSGHITGYTQDTTFNIRARDTESRVEMVEVTAQNATQRLMVCACVHDAANTVYTAYLGTMPLTASSASDLVGLDGGASLSEVTVYSGTSASHEHAALIKQDPATGDVHMVYGYVMTEASTVPLLRRRLALSGDTTWSIGSETTETTESASSMVCGLAAASNGVYRVSVNGSKEARFDKLSGDTLTQDVFPPLAMPITVASAGNAVLGVNAAGTEAYVAIVEYSGYTQCGICVSGVWTTAPTYNGYTSVLGIGGVGWNAGVAGIFMQNVNSSTADHYMSIIRETAAAYTLTASVTTTTSSASSQSVLHSALLTASATASESVASSQLVKSGHVLVPVATDTAATPVDVTILKSRRLIPVPQPTASAYSTLPVLHSGLMGALATATGSTWADVTLALLIRYVTEATSTSTASTWANQSILDNRLLTVSPWSSSSTWQTQGILKSSRLQPIATTTSTPPATVGVRHAARLSVLAASSTSPAVSQTVRHNNRLGANTASGSSTWATVAVTYTPFVEHKIDALVQATVSTWATQSLRANRRIGATAATSVSSWSTADVRYALPTQFFLITTSTGTVSGVQAADLFHDSVMAADPTVTVTTPITITVRHAAALLATTVSSASTWQTAALNSNRAIFATPASSASSFASVGITWSAFGEYHVDSVSTGTSSSFATADVLTNHRISATPAISSSVATPAQVSMGWHVLAQPSITSSVWTSEDLWHNSRISATVGTTASTWRSAVLDYSAIVSVTGGTIVLSLSGNRSIVFSFTSPGTIQLELS